MFTLPAAKLAASRSRCSGGSITARPATRCAAGLAMDGPMRIALKRAERLWQNHFAENAAGAGAGRPQAMSSCR